MRRFWIGGVLLGMMLFGMMGCGGPQPTPDGDPPNHMLDGPGMMYTPEDQTPFAGTWQSRDGTIVMEVTNSGRLEETSQMSLSVNGKPDFEAEMWVYSTGHVELSRGGKKVSISGTFRSLRFSTGENAFYGCFADGGSIWLTKDGVECSEKDVFYTQQSQQSEQVQRAWVCPGCKTENTGKFCTECGSLPPASCEKCGWRSADGNISAYCPECGERLK